MNSLDLIFFKRKRFYHMGIVISKDLLCLPKECKNIFYIWESSNNTHFQDYKKKRYKGIRLCDLEDRLQKLSLKKSEKIYHVPVMIDDIYIDSIKDFFTSFFSRFNGHRYPKGVKCIDIEHNHPYTCNEFVTLVFKSLGIIKTPKVFSIQEFFNGHIPEIQIGYPRCIF